MKGKRIKTPTPVGPYSPFVKDGNLVFCSGQIGINPETNKLVKGIEKQTHQVLKNLSSVLKDAGANLSKVLKTTIYLTDVKDFTRINAIYSEYFKKNKPARSTVGVKNLPKKALIEIDAIARLK